MAQMRAMRMHAFGEPDVLEMDQIARPAPKDGEVLVKVLAASVNPVDYKIRKGGYPAVKETDLPFVPGRDVCGEIAGVGPGVLSLDEGELVYAFLDVKHGGYEEFVTVPVTELARKPKSLNVQEAAAVPLAAITAWQGLFDHGGLAAGQRVLIHGGSGGVGHFAIQFAKAKGAWVAATVSGADRDFALELGADQAIDYRAEQFDTAVSDLDMVFDLIGGETRERSFAVLSPGGIMVSTLGEPDRTTAERFNVRVAGYMAQPNGRQLEEIGELIDGGQVRVEIQRIFPLAEAADAQRFLENEHVRGKVVLKVAD